MPFFEELPVSFARPLWLLAFAAIPWMLRVERGSMALMSRGRARLTRWIRFAVVSCLIFALAGLQIRRATDDLAVIFLVDRSDSVREHFDRKLDELGGALEFMKKNDKAGLVVFGADAYVEVAPEVKAAFEAVRTDTDTAGTDIARAIRLGLGLFPDDLQRRLVLVSDGNENLGDALEEAKAAAAASIPLDVLPVERKVDEEALIEEVDIPEAIDKDEPFEIKIVARATHNGPATLRVFKNGRFVGSREVELKPGKNIFVMPDVGTDEGFHTYSAVVESIYDTMRENNEASAYVRVHGKPQVLLVGPAEDTEYIEKALSGENWDVVASNDLPYRKIDAEKWDAILLANSPSENFSNQQIEVLRDYVRDLGGGFVMVGGENSYGVGGYANTPVEESLPVNMELKNKRYFPSLALAMVVDKSGSMSETTRGGATKMELANQAAVESAKLLNDSDIALVIAFDGSPKRVFGPQPVGNARNQLENQLLSLRPGGGTDIYVGLRQAYEELRGQRAQLKHIILLSDGMSQSGNLPELARLCMEAKITVSTMAVGAGADHATMQTIASLGGGRYYAVDDAARIPRIFAKETYIAQKAYLVEEDFHPQVFQENQILKGLTEPPVVKGYVVTEPKDRAEMVLLTHKGEPLLATWRFGLGKSVAFTSDAKPRWLAHWIGWDGFSQFWVQTIRWAMRSQEQSELRPTIAIERGKAKVVVDAVDDADQYINFLDLKARVSKPEGGRGESGESLDVSLRQVSPGRYEGEFEARDPGAYIAVVHGGEEQGVNSATAGLSVSYPPEYKDLQTNELLLRQLATRGGGQYAPALDELFRRDQNHVKSPRDLWFWFLMAAIILFPVDVGARRVVLDDEQKAAIRGFFARFRLVAREPGNADANVATIQSLKIAKNKAMGKRGQRGGDADAPVDPFAAPLDATSPLSASTRAAGPRPAGASGAIDAANQAGAEFVSVPGSAASVSKAPTPDGAPPADAAGALGRLKSAAREAAIARSATPSSRFEPGKPLIIRAAEKPTEEPKPAGSADATASPEVDDAAGGGSMERLMKARERARKRK